MLKVKPSPEKRSAARIGWCEKCERFTAQIPWAGRKYHRQCCRCGRKWR